MNKQEILNNKMIEVELLTSFNNLKEVLTRFGIANRATKTLTQSVHVYKAMGSFYLCHFKQLFEVDGKPTSMNEEDYDRFHMIVLLLEKYGLVKIKKDEQREKAKLHKAKRNDCFSIKKAYVSEWTLKQKYTFGLK